MTLKKILLIVIFILNGIILFMACKKEKTEDPPEFDTQASQDNALAEGTFNDINNIVGQAIENHAVATYKRGDPQNSILSSCAAVNVTPNSGNGGNISVDFGANNCLCLDGRYRRGIINIAYTGAYRDSGTTIVSTFSNFYVGRNSTNMYQVTGSKTVTNNGHNSSGHLSYTVSVNGHLINSNGIQMDWTSTRTREWVSGETTPLNWGDDEYVITGNASGTNFNGNGFTVNITQGLHIEYCRWITEGSFELTPSGKPTRTFDYGNGTCDSLATLTVHGQTFNIVLR